MIRPTQTFERDIRAGKIVAGMSFQQKVWALTAQIPGGSVATYADIARQLRTTAYRAVGQALHRNPYAPGVPCHRVVGSNGKLTGFAHGLEAKRRLLEKEGIELNGPIDGLRVDLSRHRVKFNGNGK